MKPFYHLNPFYRHGGDTPWGGDALRRLYGKEIPDGRTGEALEASTLAGMESVTDDGRPLSEIAGGPLPLLLKLLDARETLSVQVHPDDAYANAHEQGKLGKTEAWLILHAEPGARLVYGLKPGTDVRALGGKEIEAHLNWVDARPGDVFFIPAGMVHAIGAGIVLYEIQQSSDVTYRFWDWDRRDSGGNPRALHWDKACDVTRTDLPLARATQTVTRREGGQAIRYLDTPHFSLDCLRVETWMGLPTKADFQFVTGLGPCVLRRGKDFLELAAGNTAFVPGGVDGITVEGRMDLIVSAQGA